MSNPQISETIVRIREDAAARAQLVKGIGQIRTAVTQIAPDTRAAVASANSHFKSLDGTADRAASSVEDLRSEVKRLNDANEAFDNSFVEQLRAETLAAKEESDALKQLRAIRVANQEKDDNAFLDRALGIGGGLGSTTGSQVASAGSKLRALPSTQIPGLGIGTDAVANIGRTVGAAMTALGVTLGELAVIAAPVVVALAAVAIAFKQFNDIVEAGKRSLNVALNAQKVYYEAVANSTTEQVQKQLADLRASRAAIQQQIDETRGATDSAFQQAQAAASRIVGPFGDLLARLEDNNTPVAQLRGNLEGLQKQLNENDSAAARLTQGLANNAFATNDVAEAFEASFAAIDKVIAQARAKLLRDADAAGQDITDSRALRRGTLDQAKERRQAAEDEIAANEARISVLEASGNTTDEVTQQIARYNEQIGYDKALIRDINDIYVPMLTKRELEAEALQKITDALDAMPAAGAKVEDAADKVRAAEQALADARTKGGAAVDKITADEANKEAKLLKTRDDALTSAAKKRDDALEKLAIDHAEALKRINSKYNLAEQNAVGNRDALAAFEAKQTQKTELDEEKTSNRRRKTEIIKTYRDEIATAKKRYTDELTLAQQAARAAISIEQQKATAEISLRQQALTAAVHAYQVFFTQLQSIANSAGRQIVIPTTTTTSNYAAYQASQGVTAFQSRDKGGPIDAGKTYRINGEPITFGQRAYAHGMPGQGGATINIMLDGKSYRTMSIAETTKVVAEIMGYQGAT